MLYDEVNEISAQRVCDFLLKASMVMDDDTRLTLFINTPGGSVTDGWSIVDTMELSRIPIRTVGIGSVISMGVPIFIAGTKGERIMTPNANVMAHTFAGYLYGKSHELIAARKFHDRLERQFLEHFKRHTQMTEKQIKDIMIGTTDSWLEPKECLKYGICDEIRSPWDLEEDAEKEAKKPQSRTKKAAASSKVNK
jgi:ATP-dependent Clp protease protease subunit